MVELTRVYHFSAAHQLVSPALSPEQNAALYGDCHGPHGHNYYLEVTVAGQVDPVTGMVIDLGELKRVVGETVVDRFDHADLAVDPLFRGKVATTENIALAVWELLAPKLGADRLWQVRVWEDPTLYVDVRGEVPPGDEPSGDVR